MKDPTTKALAQKKWLNICELNDILPNMGRCILLSPQDIKNTDHKKTYSKQVAIFRIISLNGEQHLYAIDNYCPFSNTNTISRGIIGSIGEQVVVASPLYKQHFDLNTGQCLEDETIFLNTYSIRLDGDTIQLAA